MVRGPLTCPLPPRALSPNRTSSKNWAAEATARSSYRRDCGFAFLAGGRPYQPIDPATCRIEYRQTRTGRGKGGYRPHDIPNAVAALKPMFDALKDTGWLLDDAHDHLCEVSLRIVCGHERDEIAVWLAAGRE